MFSFRIVILEQQNSKNHFPYWIKIIVLTLYISFYLSGKHDIFGADMKDSDTAGQSLYFVRALSYCDINKIELDDLKEVLQTYPEFAEQFIKKFHVTFDLKKVSKIYYSLDKL